MARLDAAIRLYCITFLIFFANVKSSKVDSAFAANRPKFRLADTVDFGPEGILLQFSLQQMLTRPNSLFDLASISAGELIDPPKEKITGNSEKNQMTGFQGSKWISSVYDRAGLGLEKNPNYWKCVLETTAREQGIFLRNVAMHAGQNRYMLGSLQEMLRALQRDSRYAGSSMAAHVDWILGGETIPLLQKEFERHTRREWGYPISSYAINFATRSIPEMIDDLKTASLYEKTVQQRDLSYFLVWALVNDKSDRFSLVLTCIKDQKPHIKDSIAAEAIRIYNACAFRDGEQLQKLAVALDLRTFLASTVPNFEHPTSNSLHLQPILPSSRPLASLFDLDIGGKNVFSSKLQPVITIDETDCLQIRHEQLENYTLCFKRDGDKEPTRILPKTSVKLAPGTFVAIEAGKECKSLVRTIRYKKDQDPIITRRHFYFADALLSPSLRFLAVVERDFPASPFDDNFLRVESEIDEHSDLVKRA